MRNIYLKSRKSQIWIETVIYTLIGLAIIGILLSIIVPQLEKMKDNNIIKQTIEALDILDSKISEIEQATGGIGKVNFKLAKGKILINGSGEYILYIMEDTKLEYSQVDKEIKYGNLNITTKKKGNRFNIYIKRDYSSRINISIGTSGGGDDSSAIKLLQPGSTPYNIYLENKGQLNPDDKTKIVIRID
ncbi:MAG: hypothetical protein QXW97_03460 [Candidatus Pacearchaeota archaeon]